MDLEKSFFVPGGSFVITLTTLRCGSSFNPSNGELGNRMPLDEWLHLADSMVCNYILSKGRTSSLMLQPLTREIAAHLLALNSVQLQGHVDSIENPTDAASRGD